MANLFNFENENSAFQQFLQFNKSEKEQQHNAESESYVGLTAALPMAGQLIAKGKAIFSKGQEVVSKTEELANKVESGVQKGEEILKDTATKLKGAATDAVQEGKTMVGEALNKVQSTAAEALGKVDTTASEALGRTTSMLNTNPLSKFGQNMSRKMAQNEFERDPESDIADLRENQDLITRARSIFRTGSEVGENVAKEGTALTARAGDMAGEAVSRAAGLASETAGEAVAKASSMAGEVASKAASAASEAGAIVGEAATSIGAVAAEAVPVVGELVGLGLGIFDIVSSYEHAPQITASARPIFAAGV
jgi:ElaB/YqjD/DUF883 family membrane-anchored ribosome-binding protein